MNPVVKVVGIHALIVGGITATATVVVDLYKLWVADK